MALHGVVTVLVLISTRWQLWTRRCPSGVRTETIRTAPGRPRRASSRTARLTASTAAVLLVLLAAEGLTILSIHSLLSPHVFIGMVLVPPVLLKFGSTSWRFVRYYRGAPAYRHKGPPPMVLRLLGPFVVALTVVVLASGIALLFVPRSLRQSTLFLHKASFVLWFGAMAIHVIGHILETTRLAPRDWVRRTAHGGERSRLPPMGGGGERGARSSPRLPLSGSGRPLELPTAPVDQRRPRCTPLRPGRRAATHDEGDAHPGQDTDHDASVASRTPSEDLNAAAPGRGHSDTAPGRGYSDTGPGREHPDNGPRAARRPSRGEIPVAPSREEGEEESVNR